MPVHYHKRDIETYFILKGHGVIYTGIIENKNIIWNEEQQVKSGNCFTIYPGEIHGFKNISEETLRIIATAPLSHSRDDRYFIENPKSPNR
ncbi:MAG: cupin domain-containing protein [Acidobacterium ailaaui]|nr:cupin domain-containing protein [Pseudacidobacterium ailaaui]